MPFLLGELIAEYFLRVSDTGQYSKTDTFLIKAYLTYRGRTIVQVVDIRFLVKVHQFTLFNII